MLKQKILIIDDSIQDREIYRESLNKNDDYLFEFVECEVGQEALNRLLKESFNCILLDYQLPDMNGLEFLDRLKILGLIERAPLVMITGQGDERIAVQALKCGAQDYLLKSDLSTGNLLRATRNAIKKHAQDLEIFEKTEKLRATQEQLSLLVDSVRDHAIILLDLHGAITQWNKGAEHLFGFSTDEVLGNTFEFLFESHAEIDYSKKNMRVEKWFRRRDKTIFWGAGSLSYIYSAKGIANGFAAIIRDETDKREFEQRQLNQTRWFETVLDFLPVPFLLVNPQTHEIRFTNKAGAKVLAGENTVANLFFQKNGDKLESLPLPYLSPSVGEQFSGGEFLLKTSVCEKFVLVDSAYIEPIYEQDPAVAIAFQDISPLKKIQEDLHQAKHQAEHANEAKGQFLANMSHEIRTPLGAIMGFTELLVRKPGDDNERTQFAATIRRNGHALMQIIDDILDFSKIEAGKLEFEFININIRGFLSEIFELMSPRASDRGLLLKSHVADDVPEIIQSDTTRLRQILFNVIGNAIKFTPEGVIHLSLTLKDPSTLEYMITDTGIGIEEESQTKLFKPFGQADASTTRKFGGTGLGLMLSKRLAEAMKGRFFLVSSQPGVGSTFALILPLVIENSKAITHSTSSKNSSIQGSQILLIEDSEDNRSLFENVLRHHGAEIETASNGQEGVEMALQKKYDLILTDIQMPIMDGYTMTKILRQKGFIGPILALTANAFHDDKEKSKAFGLNDHLTKPIEVDSFIERIHYHLHTPLTQNAVHI